MNVGLGASVRTSRSALSSAGSCALETGARLAWKLRDQGVVNYPSVEQVLARLGPMPAGPVLLVEPADNIGGGAPGDCTGVLRAMREQRVANGLIAINDPAAVQRLADVPLGGDGFKT